MDNNLLYFIISIAILLNVVLVIAYLKVKSNQSTSPATNEDALGLADHVDEDAKTEVLSPRNEMEEIPQTIAVSASNEPNNNQAKFERSSVPFENELANYTTDETVVLTPISDDKMLENRIIEYTINNHTETFSWNDEEVLIIGRDPSESDLAIEDDLFIGRVHVMLYKKESEYFIVDLGSKNGIFIDDIALKGVTKITLHQPFTLGKTKMIIV